MPCYDERNSQPHSYEKEYHTERKAKEQAEAILCAILTVLEKESAREPILMSSILSQINWEEAGVSRGFVEMWWAKHKADDVKRRQREQSAKARMEAEERQARKLELERGEALAKLTKRERKLLGFK